MDNLDLTCETFTGYSRDNIAFLQLHKYFLLRTEILNNRDQVLEYLDRVSSSRSIKLLIVAGAPDAEGRDEFISFFKNFYDRGLDVALIHRMFNFVDQIISLLLNHKEKSGYHIPAAPDGLLLELPLQDKSHQNGAAGFEIRGIFYGPRRS